MSPNRNEPCPCGSGKKYKACCAHKRSASHWVASLAVLAFALVAVWVLAGVLRDSGRQSAEEQPGRVWSAEHGHWHDTPGTGSSAPSGPAPPGKVWSAEHGHWHDAPLPGEEPAPPGKVWSAEHGHWHDAAGGHETALPAPAPPPIEENVSRVDDPLP